VLLVVDDLDTLDALRLALEQHGTRVVPARALDEALRAFERVRPTVIVSDLGMQAADPYAIIRELRARDDRRTPAIALASAADRADVARAHQAGFDERLTKPVDPEVLARRVRALAQSRGPDAG